MDLRDRSWQRLRGLRADPPGLAAAEPRRRLFSAALEQAEQLMRSAESLGTATKPINIFYGLSQGVRGVAAARMKENQGRLSGHGIKLDGVLDRELASISLVDSPDRWGSFTTIAKLLDSPSLPEPTALGDLIAALPLSLPKDSWSGRPTTLSIEHVPQNSPSFGMISRNIYANSGPWPDVEELHVPDVDVRRAWAQGYLARHYPDLRAFVPMPEGWERVRMDRDAPLVTLMFVLDNGTGSDAVREQSIYTHTRSVAGAHLAVPRFGDAERSPHPLNVVWACLWAFSMLARYEPVRWSGLVDVDRSGDATALEEILEDALDLVPTLLLDALE